LVRNIAAVAVVAALLAAATAGAQAVIDGGDVRNNSLTGKDVKNKSLTKKDFRGSVRGRRGPRGLRGLQGPQGAQGPQGPAGAAGAAGATNVRIRVGPVTLGTSTASCAPGERATGGGGFTGEPSGYLYDSSPVGGEGATPTAWDASAASVVDDSPVDVQAYAICAAP
jgi:hypothetical protein